MAATGTPAENCQSLRDVLASVSDHSLSNKYLVQLEPGTFISPGSVTIDLNGLLVLGPNTCPGTPPSSCDANGTGVGIETNDNSVTVRNGGAPPIQG